MDQLLEELSAIGVALADVDALKERRGEIVRALFDPAVSGVRAPVTAMCEALGVTREAIYKIRDGKLLARKRQRDAREKLRRRGE
jgi:hypothetical protein